MALITCPECRREVSDQAASCIGCGAPIGQPQLSSQPRRQARKPPSIAELGVAVGGGAALVGAFVFFQSLPTEKPFTPRPRHTVTPTQAPKSPADWMKAAYSNAETGDFKTAIAQLYHIGKTDAGYKKAQAKITEYKKLQKEKEKAAIWRQKAQEEEDELVQAKASPRQFLEIKSGSWYRGGFDTVCIASFTVENKSRFPMADLVVEADFIGESGTKIGRSHQKTITKIIPARSRRTFNEVNLGFAPDDVTSVSFSVIGARLAK